MMNEISNIELFILFIVKTICTLVLLGVYWRPFCWKEYWQSRKLPDFTDGYIIIDGHKYYSPQYKRALCHNLAFPGIVIMLISWLGMAIFWLKLDCLLTIFEIFILYIPLHNVAFPLIALRDNILNSYVKIVELNNYDKQKFLEIYRTMREQPAREFQVYCDKYPEEEDA